jgi:hypothetical protein
MIDPAICWLEIVKATNKSATSIQNLFQNTWLARYLQLQFIIFDNGSIGEFKREFKQMCVEDTYGIKAKPTTSHNQQSTNLSMYTKFSMTFSDHLTWKIIMNI